MKQYEKLVDAVRNNEKLTESKLKQLIEHSSVDNNSSELLSILCATGSEINGQWYTLYKITVVLKYLCEQNPKKLLASLPQHKDFLQSLKNYTHINNFGKDLGVNVRINANQLLDFIVKGSQLEDQKDGPGAVWLMSNDPNSIIEQLFQTLNSITSINSERILIKLKTDLEQLNKYLPGPVTFEKYTGLDKNPKIDATVYGKLVERIVDNFDSNFPMIRDKLDPVIENFIVVDGSTFPMFHEVLITLTDALKTSKNEKVTNSLVILLENLIKSDSLFSTITNICKADNNSAIEREELETQWRNVLQLLVSLPTRIANKLNGKIPNTFLPATYAKILSFHVARSVQFFDSSLGKLGFQPDVKMISMLISKAFITLNSWKFEHLIDIFSEWCSGKSDGMKNLVQSILSHVDRPAVQPIAVLFLKRSDPALGVEAAFGDLLTNPHWKHALTIKIPLMTYYEDENLAKNLINYLSNMTREERILPDLVTKLLDIWGDRSALNHTSLEQHEYITKLILMSVKKMKKILTKNEKEEIKRLLFSGTSVHLESTQTEVRGIGMITGEIVIENLNDSEDEPKLKYDYEGMPEKAREIVEKLRNLDNVDEKPKNPPADNQNNLIVEEILFETLGEKKIYELAIDCGIVTKKSIEFHDSSKNIIKFEPKKEIADSPQVDQASEQDSDDNLDSDDELMPYDMSNDTPISQKLRPTYLRDLRDNLLNAQSNSGPEIFAESMRVAEDLILSQLPNDDPSFAIELLEILVTLREISYMEDFEIAKYKACIAIVMVFPKDSAKYLCNEFHAKLGQYSIKDRLFILDILGQSAQKLSKIETKKDSQVKTIEPKNHVKKNISKPISLAIDTSSSKKYETLYDDDFEVLPDSRKSTNDWQEIVGKRIESNTRRFAHPTKLPVATMNRFNDVAASFFYPLLYGFRREGTCMYKTPKAIEDQENILLVNYLKTLSKIMMAAENCVLAPKMGKEMMELAWSLRYHSQAKVRLCIIENIASVVITLPKEGLTGELMELIFEFRAWLSDVSDDGIRGDPDSQCRNLGKNVVALIDSIFRSTLQECSD